MTRRSVVALAAAATLFSAVFADDWTRFRGTNGTGVSSESAEVPTEWNDSTNLKWSVDLPGPGLSSPIVVGDGVFVTSWTGYAAGAGSSDDQSSLQRALVCIDRNSGDIRWTESVDAELPEDDFSGMFAQNGYASHTPVSDGDRVYCFFGKSGVVAFDMEGEKIWQVSVGTDRDPRGWGSAASPILYGDTVIVTAAAESNSMVALDKSTGEEVWRQEAESFSGTWGTPILVKVDEERTDLVLAVPFEIWGMSPETGKLRWYSEATGSHTACESVVAREGREPVVYLMGGREGGGVAVKVGGEGDVSESHLLWRNNGRSRIGTPVVHENRLYWIANGIANCIDAETGETIYKERLRGGNGGGGGRRGGDYSSPIIADGKLYYITRGGDAFVIKLGDEFELLGVNRFESDEGEFSATPAVSSGQIFIRSTDRLYCVAE